MRQIQLESVKDGVRRLQFLLSFPESVLRNRLDFMSLIRHLYIFEVNSGHKPVRPEPDGFVADIDTAFMQQTLDVLKQEWKADVQHYRQANDLG